MIDQSTEAWGVIQQQVNIILNIVWAFSACKLYFLLGLGQNIWICQWSTEALAPSAAAAHMMCGLSVWTESGVVLKGSSVPDKLKVKQR